MPKRPDGSRIVDEERSYIDTWIDMEKLLKTGKTKAIGVSNVSQALLEPLLEKATVVPAANQVELHPYLPQHELFKFCTSKGILMQAYSPLGSTNSPLLEEPVVVEIAKAHSVSPATVVLSWGAQRGGNVLPKSVTPERIVSNGKLVGLSKEEMKRLDELSQEEGKTKRFIKPDWGFDLKFDNW